MTLQTTASAGLTSEMKIYYDRRLLARALPELVYAKFGQRRAIPKGGGKSIEFRKFATLGVSKTALTEGTPPAGQSLSVSAITATVSQYGDVIFFSDLVSTVTFDPILEETTNLLAEQSSESIDELVRDQLVTGTNVQFWDGSRAARVNIIAGDVLNVASIRKAVLTLNLARASKINGEWQAIIHPRQAHDLIGTAEWVQAQLYAADRGSGNGIFDGSLGALYGVRFWVTDKAPVVVDGGSGGTVDVYQALFFGANAFGIVDLSGHNLQSIFKPLGSAGAADPLNQKQSMGWKVAFTTRILSDEFMVRVETSTSTGAN